MENKIGPNHGSGGKQEFPPEHPNRLNLPPAQLLAIALVAIFLAEVVAMIVISFLGTMSYIWEILVDALIMVSIVFPVLYFLSFRPLLAYLHQREQAMAELRQLQLELEQRVEQRTADLNLANRSLEIEIAERKQAEEQLRYQATLLENVSDAIVATDLDFKITSWNQAAETLYGWRADEVIGQPTSKILHTEYAHQKPEEVRRQILEGGAWKGEALQKRKNDTKIDILASVSYVKDQAGEPIGVVSVNRDITERKRAEAEIQSLAKFPGENPRPVLRVAIEGRVLYANSASEELLHWWNSSIGEKLPDEWCQVVSDTLDTGRIKQQELQCGEHIYSLIIAPFLDSGYVNIYGDNITARKKAEEQLHYQATLLENVSDAIVATDLDFIIMSWNQAAETLYGWRADEVIGQPTSGILLTEYAHEKSQEVRQQFFERGLWKGEVVQRHKDGAKIDILASVSYVKDQAGEPIGVVSVNRDITERKQVEQAILLAKQEWERTFDAVPDLVAILDNQHNILRLNQSMAERIGRPPQECIGLKCYDVVHGLACAPEFCPHLLTCQDGQTHSADIHEPRLGGDFLVSTTPLFNPDGNLVASVLVARDITIQKQAEHALRQARDELDLRVQQRTRELAVANERLAHTNTVLVAEIAERERVMAELQLTSAALEAAANGIFITGRRGNIRWINPAFTALTGYTADEVIGQNPRLLKSGEQPREFYQQMWDTIHSGQVWRSEITNRRKDGSSYVEEQTITPIRDAEGQITHFIAIQQDITERIQAAQTLIQTNELLERYFSSIDTLIAYMDRDFNFIRVNEAYAKSAGYPADYFLGKNHFGLYPHAENLEIFQRVVDTGDPYAVFEKPFEYPDHPEWGVTYWDWSLQPVKRSDGFVEGLVLSLVDVTGRKRAEDELARQNQELLVLSQTEHALREFAESLAQSTILLNSSLELEQVLVTILEQIRRAVPFSAADIILKEGRGFRVAGILNDREMREEWPPAGMPDSLDDFPLLDKVFATLQPMLIADVDGTADWQRLAGLEWVRSYVGVPLVAAGQVFGIINLHSDQPGAFDQRAVERLMAYTAPAAAAMQNAWLFEQVRSSRERLQALSRRLVEVQEGERRYIASELHDEVGQALTGLTLGLQLVDKKADDPRAVRDEVAGMNRMLEGVLEDLHRLAMDLRPASLDHLGLAAALRQHVAMINEKHGLAAQFEIVGIQDRLPNEIEIAFYRIVQEALNNVVRHARARRVDVILEQRESYLVLVVEDDGVGFDTTFTLQNSERLGLFGMRERAEMLGGKLIIESAAGKGTTLVVEVPYGDAHPDR